MVLNDMDRYDKYLDFGAFDFSLLNYNGGGHENDLTLGHQCKNGSIACLCLDKFLSDVFR